MMLQKQGKSPQKEFSSRAKTREKRRSIIKIESIEDDEMLAIIGDLTVLQSQLEEEIQCERERRDSFKSEIKDETQSLLSDETMTVSQVTQILAEKNLVTLSPLWALVE